VHFPVSRKGEITTQSAETKEWPTRASKFSPKRRGLSEPRRCGVALREDLVWQGKGELARFGLEGGERDETHAVATGRLADSRGRARGARLLVDERDDGGVLGPEALGVDPDLSPRRDRPYGWMPHLEPSIAGVVKRVQPALAVGSRRLVGMVAPAGEAPSAVDPRFPWRRRR
jgi:hypothetical protein